MGNNSFKKYFNKHQKTAISLLFVLLVVCGELSVNYVTTNVKVIENNRDKARRNEHRLDTLEKAVNKNGVIIENVVTRESFNAYIRRTDQEQHSQAAINNLSNRDIGMLTGRLDTLENILYKGEEKQKK